MNDMVHRESVSILLEEKHRRVKTLSMEAFNSGIWGKLDVQLEELSKAEAKSRQLRSIKIYRLIRARQSNLSTVWHVTKSCSDGRTARLLECPKVHTKISQATR